MSAETAIVIIAIVVVFAVFAVTLAWAQVHTHDVQR